ncbi:unnamed protein product [Meloidogyne enterolobii]|uniref:Uncharacterized protein n=1 Tax=Meloidogyne enterolobii TaxID=390850 RepID=A0ACB0XPH8_MELEN
MLMIILIFLFLFKYSLESKEANNLFENNIYELKLLMIEKFVTGQEIGVMEEEMEREVDGEEDTIGEDNMVREEDTIGDN